jgi:superfamily II DNA/RNA helicase
VALRKNARHDQQRIGKYQIDFCILDEADEMLNMGFYEDIVNILNYTRRKKYMVILGYNACRSS